MRIVWSKFMELFVLDLWRERLHDLRAKKRNGNVYSEMAAAVNSKFGITYVTGKVLHDKICNLTQRYRKQKQNGASPSTWPLYEQIHEILGGFSSNDLNLCSQSNNSQETESETLHDTVFEYRKTMLTPQSVSDTESSKKDSIAEAKKETYVSSKAKRKKYENRHSTNNDLLELAKEFLEKEKEDFDETIYISKTWANKLKKLPKTQKLLAEKAINDILFEAEMGLLTHNSAKLI